MERTSHTGNGAHRKIEIFINQMTWMQMNEL